MNCKKCKNNLWRITTKKSCDNCENNMYHDTQTDEYEFYSKDNENLIMDYNMVGEEGECFLGASYDYGCHIYVCDNCGWTENLPMMVE